MAIHLSNRDSDSRRTSYYLLLAARGGCIDRSKVGLDLDLVATKRWMAPIKATSGAFALKTFCREVQFEACIVCLPNTLVVFYSGGGLSVCALGASLAFCYTVRWASSQPRP
jgi:hypothetical protein